LVENSQHNTYDIAFFGANTFVGSLYLAALRAGAEMAREMGDSEYVKKVEKIYRSGKKLTEEKLWNGEYFIQQVDLKKYPEFQYGPGCLSDQLFGQTWAHQTQLGYIYAPDKVKSAMKSIWKYNWAPDTGLYNEKFPAGRGFTSSNEAGLFVCTWPNSPHLDNGVLYRDEVWTGIEYQVASEMIYEGMITEGLAVCRAIHERYSPDKRNPYNEIECSDFYARAMASWGVLLALSGYQYHGPKGIMEFNPRLTPGQFKCAFTSAEGWGQFSQKMQSPESEWNLSLDHGTLKLKKLRLPCKAAKGAKALVDLKDVAIDFAEKNEMLEISFDPALEMKAGQNLKITANN
jgi:hypothetical protein